MNKKQVGQIREKIREESEFLTDFLAENWTKENNIPAGLGLDSNKTKGKKIRENLKYFVEIFDYLPNSKEKIKFFKWVYSQADGVDHRVNKALEDLNNEEYDRVVDPLTDKLIAQVYVASAVMEELSNKATDEWEDSKK